MTKPMMDLRALVEKSADADLLREMIRFAHYSLQNLPMQSCPIGGLNAYRPSFDLKRAGQPLRSSQKARKGPSSFWPSALS